VSTVIHTRYGSAVTILAYDDPWVTVRYRDGETRRYFLSDLRAPGGIDEIMAVIAALPEQAKGGDQEV